MVNSPDAPGDDYCTVTGIRAIDEPGEGLVELEVTVGCSRASLWKDRPGEHPWFGQFRHRVRLIWGQGQMGVDPDDGSGSRYREVNLRTSSGLSGKQRGTLTPNIRLCWLDAESMPCARRRLNARGRPTRPSVPAWQKIRPASTRYRARPISSSCCRAASSPWSLVLPAVRVVDRVSLNVTATLAT